MKKRNIVIVGAVAAAVVLTATVALAVRAAAPPVSANGGLHVTKIDRASSSFSDDTSEWVDVTQMRLTVAAPSQSLIVVRFNGESSCFNAGDASWCSLRVQIGGGVGEPDEGTNNAFDDGNSGNQAFETHGFTRSRLVGAGTYTIQLQMNANGNNFRLDDMSMEVQVIDV